jgi:stage II sporulation protein GA (sporulation sigma-E factor processing peptidase)
MLHRKLPKGRFCLASALGGLYALISLFWDMGQAFSPIVDVLVCLGMCGLVFGGKQAGGLGGYFGASGLYFILSMALGGMMTALYHVMNRLGVDQWFPSDEEGMGVWLFALLALFATVFSLWGGKRLKRYALIRTCTAEIWMGGSSVTLEGMVDTGNLLREPLSGRAVLCADSERLMPILSEEWRTALRGVTMVSPSLSALRGLRLIPSTTADGEALLVGFLPDRVCLRWQKNGRSYSKEVDTVVAGVHRLKGTQILVPVDLLG